MGLLDAFKQYWQDASPGGVLNPEIPKDTPVLGLLADPMGSIRSTLNKANAQADAHLNKLSAASRETAKTGKWTGPAQQAYQGEIGNWLLNTFGPLQTVWHGSPHKFDKFDFSKIGTGEGAQAYGHGGYLAEAQGVAGTYKTAGVNEPMHVSTARDALADPIYGNTVQEKVTSLQKMGEKQAAAYLEKNAAALEQSQGYLYKVDLPDDAIAKMLDWDKPLSQQPQNVKDFFSANGFNLGNSMSSAELHSAAKKYLGSRQVSKMANEDIYFARDLSAARKAWNGGADSLEAYMGTGDGSWLRGVLTGAKDGNKSGGAAYRMLADRLGGFGQAAYQGGGQAAASDALRTGGASLLGKSDGLHGFPSGGAGAIVSDGIPGIRYLDGGSRGTGAGTSNYVIFPQNEGLLTILERNGQPVNPQPGLIK